MDADLLLPLTQRLSRRTWVLLDSALAVVLLAGTVGSIAVGRETGPPTGSGWDALRYGVAVLVCAPLALRRRWPTPVLALTALGDAALVALGVRGPAQIAVAFAIYTVAATAPRRLSPRIVGAVVATVLLGALLAADGPEWGTVIAGPAVVLLGWIAGENTRTRRTYATGLAERAAEREREREERVRQAAADERLRIARELHDIVAHAMSLIAVRAGAARMVIDEQPDEAHAALSIIETTSRRALREMRRLVGVLRQPDDTGQAELEPAPGLALLAELVRQAAEAGVQVDVDVTGDVRVLPEGVDVSAYRIVQEALTNVVRHVGPTNAHLLVHYRPHEVEIELIDEGTPTQAGATRSALRNRSGHGLVGMRERVALYGGELVTGPTRVGYRVLARLPIDEEQR
ncbi:MAG TPA: histidine kinase [Acidimicrobiia bacterium]